MHKSAGQPLKIGWASADLTPDQPVIICGQFHARVSEGILDPLTATALALESGDVRAVLVSCDYAVIPDFLRDEVRARAHKACPELSPASIVLNATHTHSSAEIRVKNDLLRTTVENAPTYFGVSPQELGVMPPEDYVAGVIDKIAQAVIQAWQKRAPGGIGFGLGQAVVGRNRRLAYYSGESRMYGKSNDPEFSHVEGCEDHAVNLLCTYDPDKNLTGMAVNLACPAQVSENIFQISADFWHDTRAELRQRFGAGLFVLPQCSAAGDQSPHVLISQAAEARMLYLKGLADKLPEKPDSNLGAPLALRREISLRIAATIGSVLPAIGRDIQFAPACACLTEIVNLPMTKLTREDADYARGQAAQLRAQFDQAHTDLQTHPEIKKDPHWYIKITRAYRRMLWFAGVVDRFEHQADRPSLPVEAHVLRLGDAAMAFNPFEYYLDYGLQIKARSPAAQTFVVQLAGTGTYVPTPRSVAGKGYGSIPASNPVGPEGGRLLAEKTLAMLAAAW